MPTSVLLSIRPEFADAILEGRKTYELRRKVFRDNTVRRIVIYASSPVCRVVGEFTIDTILAREPAELWSLTYHGAGVKRDFFDEYFRGRPIGFAVKVANPRRWSRSRTLQAYCEMDRPPQSFCYLPQETR